MDTTRSSLGTHFISYGERHAFGKLVSLIPRPSQKSNLLSPTLLLVHTFFSLPFFFCIRDYICVNKLSVASQLHK